MPETDREENKLLEILRADPENKAANLKMASYKFGQGKFTEAAEFYSRVIVKNPDLLHTGLGINLAHSIILSTDWSEASKNLLPGINYLEASGWLNSLTAGKPINHSSNPIPWYTYPAIEFIENKLSSKFKVFEYGSGQSTLWWAARVLNVISIESNQDWFLSINTNLPKNVKLSLIEESSKYVSEILKYPDNHFDIIVIDGVDRNACAETCINKLKKDGFIIFDNTDNRNFDKGVRYLSLKGFKRIDFYGLIPSYTYKNCTSIFFANDNFLNRGCLPSQKQSCLGMSCFQITNSKLVKVIEQYASVYTGANETIIDAQPIQSVDVQPGTQKRQSIFKEETRHLNLLNANRSLIDSKVLLSHHWSFLCQRQPIFSKNTLYITSSNSKHPQVINFPIGSSFDVEELVKNLPSCWYPDLFVAKVDAFFNIIPRNVEALKCPKVLILGDTQHGIDPLNKMIEYITLEKYDVYITDHKRHHLWFYWLAGFDNLYWLPGLFLNPPGTDFRSQPFQNRLFNSKLFEEKTIFIGQAAKHHLRRKRLLGNVEKHVPNFLHCQLSQQDSLKAYAAADISLNISLNGDLNLRTFEIIASKGFLLADNLADESGLDLLLKEGEEYETFKSSDEMLAKISYFSERPSLLAKYRERSYARYYNELTPQHMIMLFSQLLQGHTIEDRFTTKSIKRIRYCKDTEFSRARISLYQVIQELHCEWESLTILLDVRIKITSAVDFLDLPRVNINLINWDEAYTTKLKPYLEHSSNYHKVCFVKDVQFSQAFNVIITSTCDASLLLQFQYGNIVLISNDYQGLDAALQYSEFSEIVSSKEDFEGSFFVLGRKSLKFSDNQSSSHKARFPPQPILRLEEPATTIHNLNLRTVNLVSFPDWSQPEESLLAELARVIRAVVAHPDQSHTTLLIDTSGITAEDANLALSTVAMNLLLEEDLDVTDGPEISLIGELSEIQWEALLPHIQARIVLEHETKSAIAAAKAEIIPAYQPI